MLGEREGGKLRQVVGASCGKLSVLTRLARLGQNGHLIMLSPGAPGRGELEANWDDVEEKRWVEPNGEALSCMHVREGNTSLVAVASKSGINILHNNQGGFEILHRLCFMRAACAAETVMSLVDLPVQLLITSPTTGTT